MIRKTIILLGLISIISCSSDRDSSTAEFHKVVDGIHVRTGLHDDPNLQTVIGACTTCHSAQLITQNRATRDGWEGMLRWMQETQNLGDLGQAEPIILDYLAKYYSPEETGRRKNLTLKQEDWYLLER